MSETPTFGRAAVAAPHTAAAEAGRAILQEGGDAIEAMIAMAATIAVAYPHMNGLGGDAVWTIREPKGRVRIIEALGGAAAGATIGFYRREGFDTIPVRGPLAALTVPGAAAGWALAYEFSRALGGRMPRGDLMGEATKLAREGAPVSPSEARTKPQESEALFGAPGFAPHFLHEGKIPAAGHTRRMAKLADTLEQLGHAGFEDFYRGDIGRELASDCAHMKAPLAREDFQEFVALMREPLELRLADARIYNAPPPTQGLAALMILALSQRLGVRRLDEAADMHGMVEAIKRAFIVRDRVCVDGGRARPDVVQQTKDTAAYLDAAFLDGEAQAIDRRRAAPWPAPVDRGDTVWMGAIDRNGLAVSYLQSLYWEYGSGCVSPKTGVLIGNRGVSFSLDAKHPNALAPGRRPFHTLNPAMAAFDDGRVMPYGSMGGDGQPQFQAQVFTRYRNGASLADAIDAPRFLLGRTWGADSSSLKLEDRFDPSLARALEKAGHMVETLAPYADAFGHAGALVRHARGRVEAAHDSRADGGSAGI